MQKIQKQKNHQKIITSPLAQSPTYSADPKRFSIPSFPQKKIQKANGTLETKHQISIHKRTIESNFNNLRSHGDVTSNRSINERNQTIQQVTNNETLVILRERLSDIHKYYQLQIQKQRAELAKRSEIIFDILQEMQSTHNQKIQVSKKLISTAEKQKQGLDFVNGHVNDIKGNIDEIVKQSSKYQKQNQHLRTLVEQKQQIIDEKQIDLQKLGQQLTDTRTELEYFEVNNLKHHQYTKQIVEMINSANYF